MEDFMIERAKIRALIDRHLAFGDTFPDAAKNAAFQYIGQIAIHGISLEPAQAAVHFVAAVACDYAMENADTHPEWSAQMDELPDARDANDDVALLAAAKTMADIADVVGLTHDQVAELVFGAEAAIRSRLVDGVEYPEAVALAAIEYAEASMAKGWGEMSANGGAMFVAKVGAALAEAERDTHPEWIAQIRAKAAQGNLDEMIQTFVHDEER